MHFTHYATAMPMHSAHCAACHQPFLTDEAIYACIPNDRFLEYTPRSRADRLLPNLMPFHSVCTS